MKISIKIFTLMLFVFNIISEARADIIYLKNGRKIQGIIAKETNEAVELLVNAGTVKFYRSEIEQISYSSEEENQKIEASWQEERLRKEKEMLIRQEQEKINPHEIEAERQGSHLFVKAVLNDRVDARLMVDTGASFVILSSKIAEELNINVKESPPDIKMTLADGREVSAKLIKLGVMRVGTMEAKDVEATIIYEENAFPGFDGLLGMSFLKLFKFEINLERNKLILQKLL